MTAENRIDRQFAKLLVADANGAISHLPRAALACLFQPGDLVVANAAATLLASLQGLHRPTGERIEARLAGCFLFAIPRTLSQSSSAQAIIACRPRTALRHRRFQRPRRSPGPTS
jgi:S-adenosylmethionine:tRNA-ribosyltransferase-isomerase (queuine synthetase)